MADFDYTKAMAELSEIAAKVEDPKTSLDDIGALVKRDGRQDLRFRPVS